MCAYSQKRILTGRVLQESDSLPVADAWVFTQDGKVSTVSGEKGEFRLELRKGDYLLHVHKLGFKEVHKQVILHDDVSDIVLYVSLSDLALDEVVVHDQASEKRRKHSLQTEVLKEQFFRNNAENTLSEALEKQAGVQSVNTGVGISKLMIRGMTGNRVVVNDRGTKQEGQQWGMDHGLEISMEGIEKVELVKGASALRYGSDAIAGVVNIRRSDVPLEGELHGSASAQYKSNNSSKGLHASLKGNKNGLFFILNGSYKRFGNYKVPAERYSYNRYIFDLPDGILVNTGGKEWDAGASLGISRENYEMRLEASNYRLVAGLFPGAYGAPNSGMLDGYEKDSKKIGLPRQEVNHFKLSYYFNLFLHGRPLELNWAYQRNLRQEYSVIHKDYTRPVEHNSALENDLVLETYSASLDYRIWESEKVNYEAGVSFQNKKNVRGGYSYLIPDFRMTQAGAYLSGEWRVQEKWNLNGGMRLDWADYRSEVYMDTLNYDPYTGAEYWQRAFATKRNFLEYSWAAGLSYIPGKTWFLKFNVGKSFRFPNQAELSINGEHHGTYRYEKGNADLDPESGYQIDLAVEKKWKSWTFLATPFFNYYSNYIYLSPSAAPAPGVGGQIYRYRQDEAILTGLELNVEYRGLKNFEIKSAMEYVYNFNLDEKLPLPFSPPLSNLLSVAYEPKKVKGFRAVAEHRWTADQKLVDRNEKTTKGWQTLDVRLSWELRRKSSEWAFDFSVKNLFDKEYMNHLSRYRILNLSEQGRNFVLSVNYKF